MDLIALLDVSGKISFFTLLGFMVCVERSAALWFIVVILIYSTIFVVLIQNL